MKRLRIIGPGMLVAAAFIGPGTVTTASVSGARFGFSLLWTLILAVLATIVLQEMAARLGLVTRQGLGQAVRSTFNQRAPRLAACGLVLLAVAVGNAAFQMGNISGAVLGAKLLAGQSNLLWVGVITLLALGLLASGSYRLIQGALMLLVAAMSVMFLVTAAALKPDWSAAARGAVPSLPEGSLLSVVALIGTTVVPYNLFLHAASVTRQWDESVPTADALRAARRDAVISISLGGLLTAAIMTTAATVYARGTQLQSAADLAQPLRPLLGDWTELLFPLGLLAAGLTSAVTAPLAAAYAACGVLGWSKETHPWRFRGVWLAVLLCGAALAAVNHRPVLGIVVAQAANGLLLPLVAVFLLAAVNRQSLMGSHRNGPASNVLGGLVVLITTGLGGYHLWRALGSLWN